MFGRMQYFGIPTCPYCKKRVNLIRTWSLKRQGEYQCPRCGGISNIFLSPLLYVVALLALFAGGAIYFFHKFVLDDIDITTAFQVFLPFAVFFFLSVFFVYLAKPVIKKVSRADQGKKKRGDRKGEAAAPTGPVEVYYDDRDYTPAPAGRRPSAQQDYPRDTIQQVRPLGERLQGETVRPLPPQREGGTGVQPVPPRAVPARQPRPPQAQPTTSQPKAGLSPNIRPPVPVARPRPSQPAAPVPQPASRVVPSNAQAPAADDFFAKYDDPAYIQRRLQEMKGGR